MTAQDGAGLLVFGQTGQVARELARLIPQAVFAGRDRADLTDPAACAALRRCAMRFRIRKTGVKVISTAIGQRRPAPGR